MGTTVATTMSMNGMITKARPVTNLFTLSQVSKRYKVAEWHVRRVYDRLLNMGRIPKPMRLADVRALTTQDVMLLEQALQEEGYL